MKTLPLIVWLVLIPSILSAQNADLKKAIKHYQSNSFKSAEKAIDKAFEKPFISDEEEIEARYYHFLILSKVYGTEKKLKGNVAITQNLSDSYKVYLEKDDQKKYLKEIENGLFHLSNLLVEIAHDQYQEKQYDDYFFSMDHIGIILEAIGEPTGEYMEIMAENATKIGDRQRAITYWHKMIDRDFRSEFAYKELLSMLYNLKEYNEVDELLSKAKTDFPSSTRFAEVEILRYMDKGMKHSAFQLAKKVSIADPENVDVVFLYGLLSTEHNEHDEALASFIKVAHMQTDHFETNRELGRYYYRFNNQEGHMELALKYLEKAHSLNPDDKVTKELLYTVYLETGNDDKALGMR